MAPSTCTAPPASASGDSSRRPVETATSGILNCFIQMHSPHRDAQIIDVLSALVPEMLRTQPDESSTIALSQSSKQNQKATTLIKKIGHHRRSTPSAKLEDTTEDALVSTTPSASSSTTQTETSTTTPLPVQIRPLTGGLSNALFIARSLLTTPESFVLIRIHPDHSTNGLVNRHMEHELVAWLSTCYLQPHVSLAPHLYGRFSNGRVEEFYPRRLPITNCPDLVRVYGEPVAKWIAELHRLDVPLHIQKLLQCTDDHNDDLGAQQQREEDTAGEEVSTVCLQWLQRGNRWLSLAQRVVDALSEDSVSKSKLQELLDTVEQEWTWVRHALKERQMALISADTIEAQACRYAAEIVLNHGDVQSLNVLVSATDVNDIRLIDYEYASLSPRALDLANMWLECTDMNNLRADYERDFPSPSDQRKCLRAYVPPEKDDAFVEALRYEVGRYTVVLHLQWAMWALEQWHRSDVSDYDYIGYAEQRLRGFHHHREIFWKSMKRKCDADET